MAKIKIYEYSGCSTCKKALKFLKSHEVSYEALPIVETPPTKVELRTMLQHLQANGEGLKKLFNTSGVLYKEMKMASKLEQMTEDQALTLLSQHGKLVKRPFVLGKNFGLVGFNEAQWKEKIL